MRSICKAGDQGHCCLRTIAHAEPSPGPAMRLLWTTEASGSSGVAVAAGLTLKMPGQKPIGHQGEPMCRKLQDSLDPCANAPSAVAAHEMGFQVDSPLCPVIQAR